MTAVHLLSELRKQGIEIAVDNDRLRCRAPKGVLTPELRSQLADKKEEILSILRADFPVTDSALLTPSDESKVELILNGHAVKEILERRDQVTWFKDVDDKIYRYFLNLDRSFVVEIVKAGHPATCIYCGKNYSWLPFPAFGNICVDCQPPTLDWIPDPAEPLFEGDVEFRTGPACRMCAERERWRNSSTGPWICKVCHPPAR